MLLSLSLLVALSTLISTTNANDGVVIRLPVHVDFTTARNLLKNPNATSFGYPASVAHMGLDVTVNIGTPAQQLYNPSESSTATDLEHRFSSGSVYFTVNGSLFADILNIGLAEEKQLQVNQSFGVAEAMDDIIANSLSDYEVDGVLGLAPEIRTSNGVPSLLQTLATTHNITTTTVWIESWSNNSVNPIDPKSTLKSESLK